MEEALGSEITLFVVGVYSAKTLVGNRRNGGVQMRAIGLGAAAAVSLDQPLGSGSGGPDSGGGSDSRGAEPGAVTDGFSHSRSLSRPLKMCVA